MKISSFIWPITIETISSSFNGAIIVKEFFGKKYIEVGGLMQSGKIPHDLFTKGFRQLGITSSDHPNKILILGVGGGTVISILHSMFPHSSICAVDIDPVIVEVGRKYFGWGTIENTKIIIGDVFDDRLSMGDKYDLIVIDLFRGYEIPTAMSDMKFLKKLKKKLSKNGCVIFNRLYFQKYKIEADLFLDKLSKIYKDREVYKNYFNILIKVS